MEIKDFIGFTFLGLPKGLISIILISFIVTFLQLFIYKKFTNQKEIKTLKEKQKELQKEMKKAVKEKDNKKLKELNKVAMETNLELMKHSIKPTIITFIPLILVFLFLKYAYTNAGIGNIISWNYNLPIIGDGAGWLLCYIFFSLIFGIALRKILKIY